MSFNIDVKRESIYLICTITTDDTLFSSGLLDKYESIALAGELIYAAERLLPVETGEIERRLCEARRDLPSSFGA